MKTKKILFPAILAGALVLPAAACDLCSIYSAAPPHGDAARGWFAGVAGQFTHFGSVQQDGGRVPNDAPQHMDSAITQLLAGYDFNHRFGLQLNLPFITRSFQRPDGAGGLERGRESGLGDLSLTARLLVWQQTSEHATFRWQVLGGLKLPTGSTRRLYEEVLEQSAPPPPPGAPDSGIHGHDLALGSGSVDGVVGTSIYGRWNHFFINAGAQFALRTKGDFAYQYAHDLTWSGGPGMIFNLGEDFILTLQANVSGETKGQDTFQGATAADTGVTAVYLGPQLGVTWKNRLRAELGVDLPVSLANTAFQTVPDYKLRAALNWRF